VTGYHGQFENFAILMVLTGILMYLWFAARPVLGTALLWLFATAGMIVKHNVFYELIICLNSSVKRYWIKISIFS
jgi:ABC-type microcin C transport system permease subunit YejB